MSDTVINDGEGYDAENAELSGRLSRPSLSQVKAVMNFMAKHPDLAQRKLRVRMRHEKYNKLWLELTNIVNSMDGARKSSKGWAKFWSDKRRSIEIKKSQIEEGKLKGTLTALEQRILDLCTEKFIVTTKKKRVKEEPCNGDDNYSFDDVFSNDHSETENLVIFTEAEDKQLNMIDRLVVVMDQQTSALSQMAKANLNSSKTFERIAEASHLQAINVPLLGILHLVSVFGLLCRADQACWHKVGMVFGLLCRADQALAVDRLANTFETINASFHDVRNAILGIDYTMKRFYPATGTQQRENTNIFS